MNKKISWGVLFLPERKSKIFRGEYSGRSICHLGAEKRSWGISFMYEKIRTRFRGAYFSYMKNRRDFSHMRHEREDFVGEKFLIRKMFKKFSGGIFRVFFIL